MGSIETRLDSLASSDASLAYERDGDGALWVADAQYLTPGQLAERLRQWEAELPSRGELLASRRRHDVYRLDTSELGPLVLKYTNPGKTKRRSAVAPWLLGYRLAGALPGAVPEPIGAVDTYGPEGEVSSACLVMRYQPGTDLAEPDADGELDHALAARVGRFLARMHETGVYLKDCRMTNLRACAEANPGDPGGVEGLTVPDLEALASGTPGRFQGVRLLLKLRLGRRDLAAVRAAYEAQLGAGLRWHERLLLWGVYVPARRLRGLLVRYYRRQVRPRLFASARDPAGVRRPRRSE